VHARDKKLAFDNQVHTIEFSRTRHSPYRPNQWPSEKQSNNQNQTIPVNRKRINQASDAARLRCGDKGIHYADPHPSANPDHIPGVSSALSSGDPHKDA
ncbi:MULTISPECIES: hypothetical protein, partial [unclassified Leucobacter]|uniref:hypothetical protein n=1 Tax=unclassified Leucobacter TaxID=2621730 RepID=UPI001BFDC9DC